MIMYLQPLRAICHAKRVFRGTLIRGCVMAQVGTARPSSRTCMQCARMTASHTCHRLDVRHPVVVDIASLTCIETRRA